MNPSATTPRTRSLAIMMRRRSKRSSQHARERTDQNRRYRAGQHHAGNHTAVVRHLDREAQDRDVVEVIAHFADDLAKPGIPVVSIAFEAAELKLLLHQRFGCRNAICEHCASVIACPKCLWVCSARCTSRPITVVGRRFRPTARGVKQLCRIYLPHPFFALLQAFVNRCPATSASPPSAVRFATQAVEAAPRVSCSPIRYVLIRSTLPARCFR